MLKNDVVAVKTMAWTTSAFRKKEQDGLFLGSFLVGNDIVLFCLSEKLLRELKGQKGFERSHSWSRFSSSFFWGKAVNIGIGERESWWAATIYRVCKTITKRPPEGLLVFGFSFLCNLRNGFLARLWLQFLESRKRRPLQARHDPLHHCLNMLHTMNTPYMLQPLV